MALRTAAQLTVDFPLSPSSTLAKTISLLDSLYDVGMLDDAQLAEVVTGVTDTSGTYVGVGPTLDTYAETYPPPTVVAPSGQAGTIITPAAMTGIRAGSYLRVDAGGSQEDVMVTAVTGSTFTAYFTKAHLTGFAIIASPLSGSAKITAAASVGQNTIRVNAISNMGPGTAIIIDFGGGNPETKIIQSIAVFGFNQWTVTLTTTLGFNHLINAALHADSTINTTSNTAVTSGGGGLVSRAYFIVPTYALVPGSAANAGGRYLNALPGKPPYGRPQATAATTDSQGLVTAQDQRTRRYGLPTIASSPFITGGLSGTNYASITLPAASTDYPNVGFDVYAIVSASLVYYVGSGAAGATIRDTGAILAGPVPMTGGVNGLFTRYPHAEVGVDTGPSTHVLLHVPHTYTGTAGS